MKTLYQRFLLLIFLLGSGSQLFSQQATLEKIKSYPFPGDLTASATGSKIAWTIAIPNIETH